LFPQNQRYKDVEVSKDSYNLSKIANEQFKAIYESLDKEQFVNALRTSFAKEVTTARHPELYEYLELNTAAVVAKIPSLKKHPNARFAYIENNSSVVLFVNGLDFTTDLDTALAICNELSFVA